MKKNQVKIGTVYAVKVGGNVVPVQIISTYESLGRYNTYSRTYGGATRWKGTNLVTNREVTIRSAAKLRHELEKNPNTGMWRKKSDKPFAPATPPSPKPPEPLNNEIEVTTGKLQPYQLLRPIFKVTDRRSPVAKVHCVMLYVKIRKPLTPDGILARLMEMVIDKYPECNSTFEFWADDWVQHSGPIEFWMNGDKFVQEGGF